jgi:hypothetical protein
MSDQNDTTDDDAPPDQQVPGQTCPDQAETGDPDATQAGGNPDAPPQGAPAAGEETGPPQAGDGGHQHSSPAQSAESRGNKLVTVVEYAAFGILCLLALVATFRFYFAASEAIRLWFSPDFVPVFQAAFNLVVLALSALGISVLVRRIA